jgi:hypothetical protein
MCKQFDFKWLFFLYKKSYQHRKTFCGSTDSLRTQETWQYIVDPWSVMCRNWGKRPAKSLQCVLHEVKVLCSRYQHIMRKALKMFLYCLQGLHVYDTVMFWVKDDALCLLLDHHHHVLLCTKENFLCVCVCVYPVCPLICPQ